ncbi:MAG: TonB C-terminal domain-containing protein [Syntrophobacterales bacterium]|nr:TonB C-terminal domain-containing protein [Syntrophobacterales bacterium]
MTFLLEVLERNHGDTMSLNNMIVLSFLLHALILSIIFFSPSLPNPRWTFGPSYTVDLVSLPSSSAEVRSPGATSREAVGLNRKNHSIIIKKETARSLHVPVRKTEIHRKSTSGNADTAIEGIKKRVASTTKGSHSSTSRGHSEMNIKMKVYYSIVWSMIKEKWALPEGILPNDNIEAIVEAKILRNGSVSNLSFEKNSGNRYFDESAIKAIKKAAPFPPLPEWLNERYIDLGIRFRSSEL